MIDSRMLVVHGITFMLVFLSLLMQETAVLDGENVFISLHVIMALYLPVVLHDMRRQSRTGLFTLLAIFFVCQFVGQVWLGNFSYLWGTEEHNSWHYMNKAMMLCFLSVLGLSAAAHVRRFADWGSRLNRRFFPNLQSEGIYLGRSFLLFALGMGVSLFMVISGLSGYGQGAPDGSVPLGGMTQYLGYLSGGANIVLYLLFYECLCRPTIAKKIMFVCFLTMQMGMALSSGMKKDTLAIFLCMFLIYYLVRNKVNLWFIVLIVLAVMGLYQFVNMYRSALMSESFNGDRFQTLIDVITISVDKSGLYDEGMAAGDVLDAFMVRLSLVDAFSLIVEYNDEVGLGEDDPTFLQDLLLTPITIFVPRFLMPFKAMSTYGMWVSHTVMGMSETIISSSYVTVEGFLYLAGGALMVLAGCFVVGAVLLFWSGFFRLEERNPLMVIVFFLLALRIVEPSTPIDMITTVTRGAIIFTLMGWFLLKWRATESVPQSEGTEVVMPAEAAAVSLPAPARQPAPPAGRLVRRGIASIGVMPVLPSVRRIGRALKQIFVPEKLSGEQKRRITELLEQGLDNKRVAELACQSETVVRNLDLERLKSKYTVDGRKLRMPERQAKYLGVEEFVLAGRRLATHIIDLETGSILWVGGDKAAAVADFLEYAGNDWLGRVEAVSCDLRAREVLSEHAPQLHVFLDRASIGRDLEEHVIEGARLDEIRHLEREGWHGVAEELENSKYILSTDDLRRHEKNKSVLGRLKSFLRFCRGRDCDEHFRTLMEMNQILFSADLIKAKLEEALKLGDKAEMVHALRNLTAFCEGSGNRHFAEFGSLLGKSLEDIAGADSLPVAPDRVERIRAQVEAWQQEVDSYLVDDYFCLKMMDKSRQEKLSLTED
ncbi:transposase [Selenomonas sp. KH1T6]|uniref:transposase n=1 Tax=Selenomonas sp. KH1T6 TaxID=3158784 RepID=UPI0008A7B69C|nr:Transposase [Selenomonas ruminantium]